jgi:SAM-dependent methyltransferase
MQFAAPAEHYDRFMGRYAPTLAGALADAAGVTAGMRVVDVGCGPGGLTRELVARVGAADVAAIDPAPQFASACRERNPGADVRVGAAEQLPWPDGEFDAALASLVIGFMRDPDQGVREMARVTRPGGVVAACMWDIATGGMTMLATFWSAVRELEPGAVGERRMAGVAEGDIADRFRRAGLREVVDGALSARADYAGFDDFWDPFTLAVGPAGRHLRSLSGEQRASVREACRARLPDGPFSLDARAWYARGSVTRTA